MDNKYLALARKYRPHSFDEVVGQKDILSALKNSLNAGKLHHAYLLSGTRGVGKTTLARIFAKSLNCQEGVSCTPCGHCAICKAIDEGSFIDLIEIDAASRTKVEDTRELLENVQYKPTEGRYKVYIIDEVHMLSTGSFNALLKTLEEPPEFVKFILATTDPQKIPATILSRCMQLRLQTITADDIEKRLGEILTLEKVSYDQTSLRIIAEAADGSMRDALSITDQAIALCTGNLTEQRVLAMLGRLNTDLYVNLLIETARGNASEVCKVMDKISSFAPDYLQIIDDLIELIHDTSLFILTSGQYPSGSEKRKEYACRLADYLNQSSIQIYYQIFLNARRDFGLAPSPRLAFDMAVIRLMEFGQVAPRNPSIPLGHNNQNLSAKNSTASNDLQENFKAVVNIVEGSDVSKKIEDNSITSSVEKNSCDISSHLSSQDNSINEQVKATKEDTEVSTVVLHDPNITSSVSDQSITQKEAVQLDSTRNNSISIDSSLKDDTNTPIATETKLEPQTQNEDVQSSVNATLEQDFSSTNVISSQIPESRDNKVNDAVVSNTSSEAETNNDEIKSSLNSTSEIQNSKLKNSVIGDSSTEDQSLSFSGKDSSSASNISSSAVTTLGEHQDDVLSSQQSFLQTDQNQSKANNQTSNILASSSLVNNNVNPIISIDDFKTDSQKETSSQNSKKNDDGLSDVMANILNLADTSAKDVPWDDNFKIIKLEDLLVSEANDKNVIANKDEVVNPTNLKDQATINVSHFNNTFHAPEGSPANLTFLSQETVQEKKNLISSEPVTLAKLQNNPSYVEGYDVRSSDVSSFTSNSYSSNSGSLNSFDRNATSLQSVENAPINNGFYEGNSMSIMDEGVPMPDSIVGSVVVYDETNTEEQDVSSRTKKGIYNFKDSNEYQPEQAISYVKDPWLDLINQKITDPMLSMIMKSARAEIASDGSNITIYIDPDAKNLITSNMENELALKLGMKINLSIDPEAPNKSPLGEAKAFYNKIKKQQYRKLIESEGLKTVVKAFGCTPSIENFHLIKPKV